MATSLCKFDTFVLHFVFLFCCHKFNTHRKHDWQVKFLSFFIAICWYCQYPQRALFWKLVFCSFFLAISIHTIICICNSWFHFHKSLVFSIHMICYHKATKHYFPMILFVSIGFMKQKTFRNVL